MTVPNGQNSGDTLFVFVDESGNLDFGVKGTKHFVLAAVATTNPIKSAAALQTLKYQHLDLGDDIEFFHASEDRQHIRNEVFPVIRSLKSYVSVHYIHAQKSRACSEIRTAPRFYAKLGGALMDFVMRYRANSYSKIVIIFDKCLRGQAQTAFLKEVKPQLKYLNKPYEIFFHRVLSDANGQIADYCAWAKYVELERGEERPIRELDILKPTSVDLF